MKVTQKQSIEKLANEYGIPIPTIPKKTLPLNPEGYEKGPNPLGPEDLKKYQSLVGSLLYINRCTRPEISIHVNLLGRRTSDATLNNWKAAMHVLRYLISSKQDGVVLTKRNESPGVIKAYADASYRGEETRSQSGNLLTINNNLIMWASRRQDVSAQSITEAEYIACSEGAKDCRWIQQLLAELVTTEPKAFLYTDNEAALKLTKTQKFHRRSRHIEHKYHYIRQLVHNQQLTMVGIAGKENPADILTKLLPMSKVQEWKERYEMITG